MSCCTFLTLPHAEGLLTWMESTRRDWLMFCRGTLAARLVSNLYDEDFSGWYLTVIEPGFPDEGHSAVDVCSLVCGQRFLEAWAMRQGVTAPARQSAGERVM